jgi:signal transduction histidine kinase/DNA-directed RNA polymerase subunit N (RpoN/RPB10)
MNQHLQNILDLIQQDESLSADEKKTIMQSLKDADKEMEISAFKLERTEKVKRTTAILLEETIEELEQKRKAVEAQNRELEIESSLERIRTVAMSMNKPDDMLDVCRIISEQLELLNVKDIRNVQTAIINEAKGIYLNYEYFSQYKRTSVLEIVTKLHPTVAEFASEMMRSKDAFFTKTFEGKELQDWREYRKKTKQDPDPILDKAESVHYYFYSIGTGALGVSTYAPLSEEEINLFKRFRNVFDLAYRRFIDIEKAIAQAKEAQIETSLERVRAQAMAMRTPEDLTGICEVLYAELHTLGFTEIRNAMINIHDDEKETFVNYDYSDEIGKSINHLTYNIHPLIEKQIKEIRNAEGFSESSYTGKDLEDMITFRKNIGEKDDPRIEQADALYYYFYSIGIGSIGISTFNIVAGEKLGVLKRFRNVFTLAYQRYTDIAQAEAQAREARIETALERVRAVAMAMRNPGDLSGISEKLFTELKALGFAELRNTEIIINNDKKETITSYYYSDYGRTGVIDVDYKTNPVIHKWADDLRKADDAFAEVVIPEKDLMEWGKYMQSIGYLPDTKLHDAKAIYYYSYSIGLGALSISSFTPVAKEQVKILERFRNVFNLSYQRYTDIAQAEAQAREAQIELGLERVRARAMAMQNSEELNALIGNVFAELTKLDLVLLRSVIMIFDPETKGVRWWMANSEAPSAPMNFFVKYHKLPPHLAYLQGWQQRKTKWEYELKGANKVTWDNFLFTETELSFLPEFVITSMKAPDRVWLSASFNSFGCLTLASLDSLSDEHISILLRFAKVFDLTYTRFNDLKLAEAQTREAQIELGLERVRARAMAMQNSDELAELVATVFKELTQLDFVLTSCIIWINNPESSTNTLWVTSSEMNQPAWPIFLKPFQHSFFKSIIHAWKEKDPKWIYELSNEEKSNFEGSFFNDVPDLPDALRSALSVPEKVVFSASFNNFGAVEVIGTKPLTDEKFIILHRFGKVFDLSYTRFNDLKKAEAQAREAQIELALERVRARTMAMQKSDELPETSHILFEQMKELGEPVEQLTIGIVYEENNVIEISATLHGDTLKKIYLHSIDEPYMMTKVYKAWKTQQKTLIVELKGDELNSYNKYRNKLTNSEMFPTNLGDEHRRIVYAAFFSKGMLALGVNEPRPPQSLQLLERFASVFDLTYTRFLDLQKAEAQAREAHIEAALERVRSRSMAMQKSEELQEVIKLVYQQLIHLKINLDHAGFVVDYNPKGDWHFWIADEQDIPAKITHPYFESVWASQFNESKEKGADLFVTNLNFEEKNKFYHNLLSYVPGIPQASKDFYLNCPGLAATTVVLEDIGLYIENFSGIPYTNEENNTLMRFGKVFQQTYTRFLDLQKAEAQAKEAKIEAALERIRARALAMQQSTDLFEVANILREEMGKLGQQGLESSTVHLYMNDSPTFEAWYAFRPPNLTSGEITTVIANFPKDCSELSREVMSKYYSSETEYTLVATGQKIAEWYNILAEFAPATLEYDDKGQYLVPEILYYHFSNFSGGSLVMISNEEPSEETRELQKRGASVFDLAYTRFNDLQMAEAHAKQAELDLIAIKEAKQKAEDALAELQVTQKQLIQSEKMASLGELTAGIAHEIQNPLNFVNNFSEVSTELVDEMNEEIDKGNKQLAIGNMQLAISNIQAAKEIANDLKQNLEKINHHGKRAGDIVKGMLQHSRSSSATKEPTDINKLADEYLRLAYHGLRAKDKSFNATMKTDFDPNIGNINIIPQDIGRVILNLITNAFYVVDEKKKSPHLRQLAEGETYEPTVTVSTKHIPLSFGEGRGEVRISVKDNGNGIPQKILDKIFQPFFTTKPTGQGTGLGLSLSYDIVKAHGGELKVETKENEGAEFIIHLPLA